MKYKLLLSVLVTGISFGACAAPRYITNDLFIYLHSGPGNNYRIVGTANAGDKVNEIDYDSDSEYAQIQLSSGKEGWIEADKLTNTPSLQNRLTATQQKLKTTQQKLSTIEQNSLQQTQNSDKQLKQLQQQLREEKSRTQALTKKLTNIMADNKKLSAKVNSFEQNIQMQWLIRGGIVAGAGLIIGLLIPYLPRRRKRNTERWM
ncbi:MAG: hypothetical protein CENE_02137 [Candidatus Celerinatantimonas neptuna]|nr:MAG: hypothetical protein CENE_02137 [Candidatus Celerinatantimonas neptuna]